MSGFWRYFFYPSGWEWSLIEKSDWSDYVPQASFFVYSLLNDYWQDYWCDTSVTSGTVNICLTPPGTDYDAMVAQASINENSKQMAVLIVNRSATNDTAVTVNWAANTFVANSCQLKIVNAYSPYAVNNALESNNISIQTGTATLSGNNAVNLTMLPCSVGMLFVSGAPYEWLESISGLPYTADIDFSLINGDINNDNRTNVLDYIQLKANYNKTGVDGHPADLNGDSRINVLDYIILKKNYNKIGE